MRSKAFQNLCRQRLESAATTAGGDSPRERFSTAATSARGSVDTHPDSVSPALSMRDATSIRSMLPVLEDPGDEDLEELEVMQSLSHAVHKAEAMSVATNQSVKTVSADHENAEVAVDPPAPATPRMSQVPAAIAPESPRTPRVMDRRSSTPPPLVPKWKMPKPPLLRALEVKSAEQVRAVLHGNPEAAKEPFWDHDVEPPLCCAVRLRCNASILELLLEHGASPEDKDMHGHTPGQILEQPSRNTWEVSSPFPQLDAMKAMPEQFPQVLLGLGCGASSFLLAAQAAHGQMPWGPSPFEEKRSNANEAWRQEARDVLATHTH